MIQMIHFYLGQIAYPIREPVPQGTQGAAAPLTDLRPPRTATSALAPRGAGGHRGGDDHLEYCPDIADKLTLRLTVVLLRLSGCQRCQGRSGGSWCTRSRLKGIGNRLIAVPCRLLNLMSSSSTPMYIPSILSETLGTQPSVSGLRARPTEIRIEGMSLRGMRECVMFARRSESSCSESV
jgi:hypothetical protein